jgi:uncharacterized protein (DUF58 family)
VNAITRAISTGLSARLAARFRQWTLRTHAEPAGDVTLERRRVFILPTRAGLLFGMVTLSIWFTSLNFGLQLGFLLAFLAASVALVAMYETHRNLVYLGVRELRCASVHAGEVADFDFVLDNAGNKPRYAIHLAYILPRRRRLGSGRAIENESPGAWADVAASSTVRVSIGLPTRRRGARDCPRVRISTRFPFGLWEAWAYASPRLRAIVYPAPEENAPPLPPGDAGERSSRHGATPGTDDFGGVRPYRPGDPLRAVAWRLAARSDDLCVKIFESTDGEQTQLDMGRLPATLTLEEKLSRLTRWVLVADGAAVRYGLVLPHLRIEPGTGPDHRQRCLEALALCPAGA